MTKIHHPADKLQRRLAAERKNKFVDKKAIAAERPSKVWRKLIKEHVKERETEDELKLARLAYN